MRNILNMNTNKVYGFLEKIDKELAREVCVAGCLYCGGGLHRDDYKRKPRWVEIWDKRCSFTCSRCRKRHTPPSVRFLGRKVYAGVVVVLVGAMMHGPSAQSVGVLHEALGIDVRTLKRWRRWWLDVFVKTPFWKAHRSRFMPVLDERLMPYCLVESFHGDVVDGVIRLLRFLAPITTQSGGNMHVM